MPELDQKQKNKLKRLVRIAGEGESGLVDELNILHDKIDEQYEESTKKYKELFNTVEKALQIAEATKKEKGETGKAGEAGKDYVLTENDKMEIAGKIKVPVVEKVTTIQKTEVVREIPMITEVVKETILKINEEKPEQIREKLESLKGEERLDINSIKGWEEFKKEVLKINSKNIYIGGASGGGRIARVYDISDKLDGITKTFSLPAFHRIISISGSSFPYTFRENTDYTTNPSAMSITFTSEITASATLAAGQTINITYTEA